MTPSHYAWINIRSLGLILMIFSLKFAATMSINLYAKSMYSEYSTLIVSSSESIPPEKDASNPETNAMHKVYSYHLENSITSGFWFFILVTSGLYLLLGGKCVHKIITRLPKDRIDHLNK
jgi:hypothetical protein